MSRYRSTKKDRLTVQLAERILADKNATAAELAKALAALGRTAHKAKADPEPPAEEATIDDLVRVMEARAEQPPKTPEPAVPPAPTVPVPPVSDGRCPTCHLVLCGCARGDIAPPPDPAPEPPRAPVSADSLEAVHGGHRQMSREGVRFLNQHLPEECRPPADGLSDYQRSVRIWQQQAADEADERARLLREIEYQKRKDQF